MQPRRHQRRSFTSQAWKGGPLGALLLALLALAVYGPGLANIPPVDRDESRFAQASRQMFESVALAPEARNPALHSGGLGIPMVGDRPRLNKPPLIYWLQSASAAVFTGGDPARDAIWMYRLPSALAALGAVLIVWRIGTAMWDARVGLLAAALLAVSPMVIWDAHQARADQVLLLTTTAAMWTMYHTIDRRRAGKPAVGLIVLLGAVVGLGVLAKGPITPLVVATAALFIAVVARRPRWIGWWPPIVVTIVAIGAALPWAWLVIGHVGADRAWSILHDEVIARSGTAKEGHWGPPGYHLVLLPALFWPGALLAAIAMVRAFRRGLAVVPSSTESAGNQQPASVFARLSHLIRNRSAGRWPELFCIAWVVPSWIVFELVSTKLPHYTLPLYPAIALLVARTLLAADAGVVADTRKPSSRIGFGLWIVIGAALLVAAMVGLISWHPSQPLIALGALALGVLTLAILVRAVYRQRFVAATRAAIVLVIVTVAPFLYYAAPSFSSLSNAVGDEIRRLDPETQRPIAAAGFTEDSLVFHTRGRITRLTDNAVRDWASSNPGGVLVLAESFVAPGEDQPLATALRSGSRASFTGINLGKGRTETVIVLRLPNAEMHEVPSKNDESPVP